MCPLLAHNGHELVCCICQLLTQSGHWASLNDPHSNRYDARVPRFGGGNETARVYQSRRWCDARMVAQRAGTGTGSCLSPCTRVACGPRRAGKPRFFDELRIQGFVEGKNLVIVGGLPTSNEQAAAVVPLILQAAPDAITTGGDFIAGAFQKATKSIPLIVMTEDMVAAGFAESLAQPGGNITGISLMSSDLDGKRQDILLEAVPSAGRIAALADSHVASLEYLKVMEESARNRGKELLVVRAASASDLLPAINDASNRGAAALNVLSSPMLHLNRRVIIARAAEVGLPAIYQWPETAEEGGLLGYGPSFIDVFRQRAGMVANVLRGAKPDDLPIEQPTKFKLVINLKTAKADRK